LVGGPRVSKSDARIECFGTIDELNAFLGLAAACAPHASNVATWLRVIQNELFVIGSHLATPEHSAHRDALPKLRETSIARLETEIDASEAELPPLRNFILPGGTELASRLHVARTVCRRAERMLVELNARIPVDAMIVRYLNRLSDWIFVQARSANKADGVEDVPWVK
jgi:cob(I)alamin adenosyltransferase